MTDKEKNHLEIKRKQKLVKHRKDVKHKEKYCFLPSCNEIAINSHIIQDSQFLKPIANAENKLIYLDVENVFPGKKPKFQQEYTSNILTFKGFCSVHDQQIFSEIEKQDFDLLNNRHLALFNYRAICHELRRKMDVVSFMELISKDSDFPHLPDQKFTTIIKAQSLGISDLKFYKKKIEDDIINNTRNFEFKVESLPKREVVASVILNTENLTQEEISKVQNPNWKTEPFKSFVLTIFPKNNELIVIIGYLENDKESIFKFIDNLGGINLNFINKIILEWIETWACSENLFQQKIRSNEEEIIKIFQTSRIRSPANQIELPNIFN